MTTSEKREYFLRDMLDRGEKRSDIAPLIYRVLWKIGVDLPPPIFATRLQHIFVVGTFGAIFWGLGMWLLLWRDNPILAVAAAIFFGLLFALGTYTAVSRKRRKLKLCEEWSDYEPQGKNPVEQGDDGVRDK